MSATVYMSSHGNLCYDGQSRGSVVPIKFLLVSVNTLLAEHETSNARNVTVHRLSAYSLDMLFTAHLHDSRLYPKSRTECCTPSMD